MLFRSGNTTAVTKLDLAQDDKGSGAEIIDLVDLLKRSLAGAKKSTKPIASNPQPDNKVAASVLNKRIRQSNQPAAKPVTTTRKKRSA